MTYSGSIAKEGLDKSGAPAIVATDLLALCLFETSPGEFGADVCGRQCAASSRETVAIWVHLSRLHGGSSGNELKRKIPGRLVGRWEHSTVTDSSRHQLQTREQHIRRDKATSNICTAQVLLAVMAGM